MEATEKLVKLFLESKGFLVTANYRFKVARNRYPEVDIIAVRPKHGSDDLPDRIIGEVKSWPLYPTHFKKTHLKSGLKSRDESGRFKIINTPEYRRACVRSIRKDYGAGFEFCIFAREIDGSKSKKWEKLIRSHLDDIGVRFISLKEVVEGIVDHANDQSYSNDSELQMIRLLKWTSERARSEAADKAQSSPPRR